jgi:lipoprotein-anchoring transpeptidase ErfK/SrfK
VDRAVAPPQLSAGLDLPLALVHRQGRQLVLERSQRRLLLLEDGAVLDQFPVAVGRPGWETPLGSFAVLEKVPNPIWQHPQQPHVQIGAGASNPLGSRWIGFWRDCNLRKPWQGQRPLAVPSCGSIGFHGTPQRGSVGRAVSHGCVRLYDEDVRRLYDLVEVGTPVTVLP